MRFSSAPTSSPPPRPLSGWERYAGLAGALVVPVVAAAIVFESLGPQPTDSAGKVYERFRADQAGVLAGSYLLLAGVALLTIFLVALRGGWLGTR